jgi:hypothetical protein
LCLAEDHLLNHRQTHHLMGKAGVDGTDRIQPGKLIITELDFDRRDRAI